MKALVTVTYLRDYGWLRHASKSIERYLTGFDRWFVWAPKPTHESVLRTAREYRGKIPLTVKWFDEWPGKGFCHHEWIIVNSDVLHGPEFQTFTNWDSDMLLCRPLDASAMFGDGGRIYLPAGDKAAAISASPNNALWYQAVNKAIGVVPSTNGMAWAPITYHRETLRLTRSLIKAHTKRLAEDYIRSCKNEFPQTFAEFNTISCVAERLHPNLYLPVPREPWPLGIICQCWSHGGIDHPFEGRRIYNDKPYDTPRQLIGDLGFL